MKFFWKPTCCWLSSGKVRYMKFAKVCFVWNFVLGLMAQTWLYKCSLWSFHWLHSRYLPRLAFFSCDLYRYSEEYVLFEISFCLQPLGLEIFKYLQQFFGRVLLEECYILHSSPMISWKERRRDWQLYQLQYQIQIFSLRIMHSLEFLYNPWIWFWRVQLDDHL